jgi:hypothetical protein
MSWRCQCGKEVETLTDDIQCDCVDFEVQEWHRVNSPEEWDYLCECGHFYTRMTHTVCPACFAWPKFPPPRPNVPPGPPAPPIPPRNRKVSA